ncbi:GyrI-like domain-containing protein [Leptospira levettii]|uniref:GyrI-like domain-containing protein n=1 Tax=Leptospira levettii TaxID=2023178 RepID=UPI0010844483|nr:GyrI-like domain-containing protein [Leptospira levettii]TGM92461.1 GyrI-like domain-containing protein [Leptospira levettii]
MDSKIVTIEKKYLVGKKLEMSLTNQLTSILWKSFQPIIPTIQHRNSNELISLSMYPAGYFQSFDPNAMFQKWALVEVSKFFDFPPETEGFTLDGGLYAEFLYKGLPSEAGPFFHSIFMDWLPNSNFQLDNRPHFEVMGEKYKNNDPESEELVYIPIQETQKGA